MPLVSFVLFVTSLAFLYFIFRKINKNKMLFEHAFVWIVIGLCLIFFSLFEVIPTFLSTVLGFGLVSNFLLTASIFFLLVIGFLHSMVLSNQKEEIKNLIQELSIAKKRIAELEKEND